MFKNISYPVARVRVYVKRIDVSARTWSLAPRSCVSEPAVCPAQLVGRLHFALASSDWELPQSDTC